MTRALAICLALAALGGCASPWEESFEPSSSVAVHAPSERVVVRRVPWDRLNQALERIERGRVESDTHPDDWSAAQRDAEKAELVQALQFSEDPDTVEILGRSVFRSTSDVDLLDGRLTAFARSIGADYAVWSSTYLGRAERVQHEAVTRHGYQTRRYRRGDGYGDYDALPYHETLYVPVVVERDEYAWVVYYARITTD